MARINKNLGFTLIEMLVVISSLALLILAGSNLFFASLFGSSKSEAIKEVRQNGEYALKVMEETIKNSYGVDLCQSGQVDVPNNIINIPEEPEVIVKDKENNKITFKVLLDDESESYRVASMSSVPPTTTYYLTSNKVEVKKFNVTCHDQGFTQNLPTQISFNFELSIGKADYTPERRATMTFSATVTSRNF